MNSDDLLEESNRILSEMIALALQGERLQKMPVGKGIDEATYRAIYHELSNRAGSWRERMARWRPMQRSRWPN